MAANFGKFIDRSPQICAAGMSSGDIDEDQDNKQKQHYYCSDASDIDGATIENNIAKLTCRDENIQTENDIVPLIKLTQNIYLQEGEEAQIQIQPLEASAIKIESVALMNDPKETRAGSPESMEDGKTNKTHAGSPESMEDDDSVRGLVHPPRTPYQVMWDRQVGHERYRTTHDDYNAPKRIEESKVTLPELEKCLKAAGKSNSKGVWVRCTCDWHKNEADKRSHEIEADYVDKHKSQIGKSLSPNHNIDSVPKGFAFGTHSHHASYGMEELMKDSDCPPCVFRRDFYTWMTALNRCRNALKERDFDFLEFSTRALDHDKEKTGFLPIDEFYNICAEEEITFHMEEMKSLLKVLNITVDGKINYGRFIEIVDVNKPAIDIIPFHDLPKENQYYETSNQAACHYLITTKEDLPPAGLESMFGGFVEPNVSHTHLHNWSEESTGSPLNFSNK